MNFKFAVGQMVEYRPIGGMIGLYTVVRQMPEEFRAVDLKYRIKGQYENFERNVLECDLRESQQAPALYAKSFPLRLQGGR